MSELTAMHHGQTDTGSVPIFPFQFDAPAEQLFLHNQVETSPLTSCSAEVAPLLSCHAHPALGAVLTWSQQGWAERGVLLHCLSFS